jgi:hypothetical protein
MRVILWLSEELLDPQESVDWSKLLKPLDILMRAWGGVVVKALRY